jgi:NadR type nicotinamide-nucleotide adenylyltransferase
MRVVVTGSECTGKTTLAKALADHFGVPCVAEYARLFVRARERAPEVSDVDAIARGQIALEDEHAASGHRLLILDTDLLSTVLYSFHYYGTCPSWVEVEQARRTGDLYLLPGIDVPWVPDGSQRDRGHRREEMQQLFRDALAQRSLNAVEFTGSIDDRLRTAIAAIGAAARLRRASAHNSP